MSNNNAEESFEPLDPAALQRLADMLDEPTNDDPDNEDKP